MVALTRVLRFDPGHLAARRAIKAITQADGLPNDEIWSVSEGPNKTIWTATKGGPSCIGRWRVLSGTPAKRLEGTRCILAHPNGTQPE